MAKHSKTRDPKELLGSLTRLQLEAELCRRSFADFVRTFWPQVEPARPFVPNLASDAVIEHLQAIGEGKLRRLLIALPPGLGKTTIASVLFPAWRLARDASYRVICASHAHSLAVTASLKTRRLVEHERYRSLFPSVVLRDDENRSDFWATTRDGRRLAVGVGGALVGFRAGEAIVDDSLNGADARSKATRDATNEWFDTSLSTRLDDPDRAAMTVIQQRLHSYDLIGHLLEMGGWEALVLPAEFERARRCVTSLWSDPRSEDGELLAPRIHSAEYLAEQKRVLGSSAYACVYGQSPSDDEGGLFLRGSWRFWKPDGVAADASRRPRGCSDAPAVALPAGGRVVISLDAAFKDLSTSDAVCFLIVRAVGAERYVLERRHGRMSFTTTVNTLRELAARYPGATFLVEDAANGTAVIDQCRRVVPNLVAVQPKESKEARAAACSPAVEAGQVFLPEGAGWLGDFVEECAAFPRGKHDDQVDALTQLLNYLATSDPDTERKRSGLLLNLLAACPEREKQARRAWLEARIRDTYPWAGPLTPEDLTRWGLVELSPAPSQKPLPNHHASESRMRELHAREAGGEKLGYFDRWLLKRWRDRQAEAKP